MKIRRALATAAATAVIAPLALLSVAPAALAEESATPSASASASESASESASASPTQTTPEPTDTASASATATASGSSGPSASAPASESAPASASTSPSSSASPSPSGSTPADICVDENGEDVSELSADLTSSLTGLPQRIVAGGGWTAFKYNVSNHGDRAIADITPLIGVAAAGWDGRDYSGKITVQVLDKASGSWKEVAGAAGEGGTFTPFSLNAGASTSYQLRLSVSGRVPDAVGITAGFAQYADDAGCWIADDPNGWIYEFAILAAGSDAGDPPDSKPQTGGAKEIKDVKKVDATGSLAETGSPSALPTIALAGGIAVVAGAGALIVVRRRRSGDATA
ncbi:LPXTG cell wall anchor domain-containing protein [Streptomyces sp. NBC_00340]|uniref:LPXTG cell wall anchor domain-containing protein n=1 Tax=Streptomyces sp. NBC_00340 TaxID=2975716 RepID=UPI00225AF978|nr:LPXTG cell wall anchor domain-containing protein [Streptomyces sp. NBC_00340]MCX5131392.1 LPXTG cell wall anchor domain-containing protein [Streptomyces sp. NBC_00340]